jgi:hypothetical protein
MMIRRTNRPCPCALPTVSVLAVLTACGSESPASDETTESSNSGIFTVSASEDSTAGSSGTEGADTSSTTAVQPPDNCGEVDFELVAVPPNVVLVLDKSGSMVSDNDADGDGEFDGFWDHDADPMTPVISRWNSLYNVVDFVVTNFDAQINFGGVLFPSADATSQYSASACVVEDVPEIPVGPANGVAILAGIPDALDVDIRGATPATAGIQTALDHLETLDPTVPQFLILVTDGAANCSADHPDPPDLLEVYDSNLPTLVGTAFSDRDVPTFVVGIDIVDEEVGVGNDGIPEANTFVELNAVAEAGGRAKAGSEKFFNTVNEIELMEALGEIAGQVVSCVIPLDPAPENPDFVEVEIGGVAVDKVDDCDTQDGWVYVNPAGPYDALQLCGSACDAYVEAGLVDATYGCPPAG